jgi:hypothetical protein
LGRGTPRTEDAYQALAYCRALGLPTALLLYPDLHEPGTHLVIRDGENELRTDGVDLTADWPEIEQGMHRLMSRMLDGAARLHAVPA